jgi:hypothetical protein
LLLPAPLPPPLPLLATPFPNAVGCYSQKLNRDNTITAFVFNRHIHKAPSTIISYIL